MYTRGLDNMNLDYAAWVMLTEELFEAFMA